MHPVGLEPMISTWPPLCCSYNESIGKVVEIYSDENIKNVMNELKIFYTEVQRDTSWYRQSS